MFFATILLLFQAFLPNPAAEPLSTREIPRFQMIADGLYRGGQPGQPGFEYLKKSGIKTVINLRTESDEEAVVKGLGMNYVHIPISIKLWSKIPDSAIEQYFRILNDPANYPIFFHCRRGADRTGAMAGFYRIAVQGWEPKKVYSEARGIGMRWWFRGLKGQLYNFSVERAQLNPVPATN